MKDLKNEERDMIIAALRLWQNTSDNDYQKSALRDVATNEETQPLMSNDEIDELIEEKINI